MPFTKDAKATPAYFGPWTWALYPRCELPTLMSDQWIRKDGTEITRHIAFSICFDRMVKIYELGFGNEELDFLTRGMLFLDFFHETRNGFYLRSIVSQHHWPTTSLVFINKADATVSEIFTSDSSYADWPVADISEGEFKVTTHSSDRTSKSSRGYIIQEWDRNTPKEFVDENRI